MKKNKVYIFDLDGVIINSISNMRFAFTQTCKKLQINLKFENYKKFLGLPFEKIMKKIKFNGDVRLFKRYYKQYSSLKIDKIKINKKLLNELKKLKKETYLTIFTSKDKLRTNKILKKYNIFDYIVTADDVKKGKPNPEGIFKIKKKFKKKDYIFFGDSKFDFMSSKRANVKYVHVGWGYEILKNKEVTRIKRFSQIKLF